VEVWDWDPPPFSHDFIGYLTVSLGKLLQHAENGNPLPLNPPPLPHKQDVGCIYVDIAVLGLPQVFHSISPSRVRTPSIDFSKYCN
jgi:hypothetical protein